VGTVYHSWGVDKSHWDPATGTARLIAEGFSFLTHKAGGDGNDAELRAWWDDTKPHRVTVDYLRQWAAAYWANPAAPPPFERVIPGAYWVLYPNKGAGAGDAFIARLDSQCPGWNEQPFILQLDCEIWGGNRNTLPDVNDIRACALRLRKLQPEAMPIVYAPRWAYGDSLRGLGFPTWSSAYVSTRGPASVIYPGDSYTGWAAYSGIVPTVAQFSSTATAGGDTTSDVNCFKGTPIELLAQLCPGYRIEDPMATLDNDDKAWLTNLVKTTVAGAVAPLLAQDAAANPIWTARADINLSGAGTPNMQPMYGIARYVPRDTEQLRQALRDLSAQLAAGVPATVDVPTLAAALDALLPDVTITPDVVVRAFREMAGATTTPAVTPAAQHTFREGEVEAVPIHDQAADDLTRREREARQRYLMPPSDGPSA
jgi:hypothetical protein